MGVSIPNKKPTSTAAALVTMVMMHCVTAAELGQGEVVYDADKIISELRTDTMELIGNVSLTQGKNSITASRAQVRSLGSNGSGWTFEDSVRVRTTEAELRATHVSATIADGELDTARAEGTPAEFQQLSGAPDEQGRGRANLIEYDVEDGVVKLTGTTEPVWFLYGKDKNEFRTNVLTYNLRTGSVSTGRTRGTIRLNNQNGGAAESEPGAQSSEPRREREDGA